MIYSQTICITEIVRVVLVLVYELRKGKRMIELDMNDTDHLVEIVTKLRFHGTHFYAYLKGNKWRIEMDCVPHGKLS